GRFFCSCRATRARARLGGVCPAMGGGAVSSGFDAVRRGEPRRCLARAGPGGALERGGGASIFFSGLSAGAEVVRAVARDRPGGGPRCLRGLPLQHALRPVLVRVGGPRRGGVPQGGGGAAGSSSGGDDRRGAGEPGAQLPVFAALRRVVAVPVSLRAGAGGLPAAHARRVRARRDEVRALLAQQGPGQPGPLPAHRTVRRLRALPEGRQGPPAGRSRRPGVPGVWRGPL
ncbi:MAG: hypothetical protein AVDCRST_MAG02-1070, partial [uncultured Rubrobacteraceae bacterium]